MTLLGIGVVVVYIWGIKIIHGFTKLNNNIIFKNYKTKYTIKLALIHHHY